MKKQIILFSCITFLNLLLLSGIFKLFQNETVYHNTLGKISYNYERTGSWENYKIEKVSKPYIQLNNQNLLWWDASIYHCISERMYKKETICHGKVRAAFFPLFPILWKVSNSPAITISVINYFMYAIGLIIFFLILSKQDIYDKSIQFTLLLSLPSAIIFIIPYTESLFLICMAIATIGIIKNRYFVYFVGALLTAMVRPATIFVLIAILVTEMLIALRQKNFKSFLKDSFLKVLPFGIGYILALTIQFSSSNSWFAFSDSHAYWSGGLQKVNAIVDWSIEGFGMNVFSITMVSIPSLVFLIYLVGNIFNRSASYLDTLRTHKINYIFTVSVLYLAGLLIFTVLTSSGNLHSYFRFTLASPLFYMAIIITLGYVTQARMRYPLMVYSFALAILILFMYNVPYGGNRFSFSYLGMYLLISVSVYLFIRKSIPKLIDTTIVLVLLVTCSIWTSYLLNIYLSNGWIFT